MPAKGLKQLDNWICVGERKREEKRGGGKKGKGKGEKRLSRRVRAVRQRGKVVFLSLVLGCSVVEGGLGLGVRAH